MTVLEDATAIVREAERLVIGKTLNLSGKLAVEVVDALLHGPSFVIAGMEALVRLVFRGILMALSWAVLLYVLATATSDQPTASGVLIGGALLGLGSLLFGLPSSLIARLLSTDHVSRLAHQILRRADNADHLGLLRRGVDEIGTVGASRIAAISWAIGLAWAALAWFSGNWLFADDVAPAGKKEAVEYGLLALVIFGLIAGAFVSYREAHRQFRMTIIFAFVEAERVLLGRKVKTSTKVTEEL